MKVTSEILRKSYPGVTPFLESHPETRILFLDIDGVLNSENYFKERNNGRNLNSDIDSSAVALLNELQNCAIVISSSWGYSEDTVRTLRAAGLTLPVIGGITPFYHAYGERGRLIDTFVKTFLGPYKYAIVDDDDDMLESQRDVFVRTDFWDGLTRDNLEQLKRILK